MWRIGIDVGGTFTDLVAVDARGRTTIAKAPSTPADPSLGVLDGLDRLAAALGVNRAAMLGATQRIVHGTTVATNALLTRGGARVGLLATAGHRDVLEMREGLKDDRYDLRLARPAPLVPRERRLGVRERIGPEGQILTRLDRRSLDAAIARLARERVDAVAICFLHSWRNPAHERAAARAVRRAMPAAFLSVSSDVLPRIKEYERTSTTAVNAYVGPLVARYLDRLAARLEGAGYRGPVLIIHSSGGVAPIAETIRRPAATALSGPAGGVAAAQRVAAIAAAPDLIAFDMGGTSTDISLLLGGERPLTNARGLAGERIALPSLDIVSIGAGGGSVARAEAGGLLRVGPQSAGAEPGPACYGRGGRAPTVTDANLVLGRLDAAGFLGGAMRLDDEAARRAIGPLARALGLGIAAAAAGIVRVVDTNMAEAVRLMAARRGVDVRRFALLAFGGAAGLHATAVARQLGIARVVVPRVASVLSAWGMLSTDLEIEVTRSHVGETAALDSATLRRLFAALEREARARMASWHRGRIVLRRAADMRYGEQVYEIDVPLDGVAWNAADLPRRIAACFARRHEALFTYSLADRTPVMVNASVRAIGRLEATPREPRRRAHAPAKPRAHRRMLLDRPRRVPVYDLEALAPGQRLRGPALVEAATTSVLLMSGDLARTTAEGWLDIAVDLRA
ncbi:MAG: hydantoinase/oxoprolinase family protein [Alphaproteobacteria bacterium]|nr:hydantoinase/oxoprolinase family protein [Alphaproteobacteria bacterium]